MSATASSADVRIAAVGPERVVWEEHVPAGCHWSGVLRRGTTLRCVDLEGGANASVIFFHDRDRLERYNMADTLKAQHTAHLTRGFVCYSDMGRVMCSITGDSCGWHDPLCGVSTAASITAKYGERRYQKHRNEMHRNGRDSLLIELGKHGLGPRDLVGTVNLFSKIVADDHGVLSFVADHSHAGAAVDLRFEMDCLVALATAPHPLDTNIAYAPHPVDLIAWRSDPPRADDPCRISRPENERGFENTERLYR